MILFVRSGERRRAGSAAVRTNSARPPTTASTELPGGANTTYRRTWTPSAQGINAVAKVEFRAQEVSQNMRVELHENLEVREVKGADGKSLSFQRDTENPLFLNVMLPSPVAVGKTVTLTFTYGGLLANEENSPVPNVRVASINKDWAYLLLPATVVSADELPFESLQRQHFG